MCVLVLDIDDDQTIYLDSTNDRIVEWKYNANNGQIVAGGNGQGSAANQLYDPYDVFVDASGDRLIIAAMFGFGFPIGAEGDSGERIGRRLSDHQPGDERGGGERGEPAAQLSRQSLVHAVRSPRRGGGTVIGRRRMVHRPALAGRETVVYDRSKCSLPQPAAGPRERGG